MQIKIRERNIITAKHTRGKQNYDDHGNFFHCVNIHGQEKQEVD